MPIGPSVNWTFLQGRLDWVTLMRWSRSTINFLLDSFAFLVLLAVLWTRVITHVIVPPPVSGETGSRVLWGWSFDRWDQLNFWLTMFFAVVILVHLVLHWTWVSHLIHQRVKSITKSRTVLDSGTQTVYGVGFLITVLMVLGGLLMGAEVMAKPI